MNKDVTAWMLGRFLKLQVLDCTLESQARVAVYTMFLMLSYASHFSTKDWKRVHCTYSTFCSSAANRRGAQFYLEFKLKDTRELILFPQ